MSTVALVGGDGSGKTTIAKNLEISSPFSIKYLYMGASILSSDKTLPTSRLALYLKLRGMNKKTETSGEPLSESVSSHDFHYTPATRGAIWITLRMINRIAEASYRFFISLWYQMGGFMVIYDRHFLFEATPSSISKIRTYAQLLNYFEYIFFKYFYPKPNLVVFLDAPPDILYKRKGEADIDLLKKNRERIIKIGNTIKNFFRVDATQPLEKVLADVTRIIDKSHISKHSKNN